MSVRLHIDRLVLDGIDVRAGDRARIVAAIETELARLVGAGGVPRTSFAVPRVEAPPIALPSNARQLGHAIAKSVYASVGGGE